MRFTNRNRDQVDFSSSQTVKKSKAIIFKYNRLRAPTFRQFRYYYSHCCRYGNLHVLYLVPTIAYNKTIRVINYIYGQVYSIIIIADGRLSRVNYIFSLK